jgi:hypothetical protein
MSASAQDVGSIGITVGDEEVTLPFEIIQDGKVTVFDFQGQQSVGGEDGVIIQSVNASFDPDPFIGYALAVVDVGAPSTFGFVFATPIVPLVAPGTITSGYSGSLTDGGSDGVSITPVAPGVPTDGDGVEEVHVVTDGFPLTNDGVDLGPAATFPGGIANVHGPFNEATGFPGAGPWTWLQINVTFEGSGGGDFYALSGRAVKEAAPPGPGVPDPASTLVLSLIGLGCCAFSRRLRVFSR